MLQGHGCHGLPRPAGIGLQAGLEYDEETFSAVPDVDGGVHPCHCLRLRYERRRACEGRRFLHSGDASCRREHLLVAAVVPACQRCGILPCSRFAPGGVRPGRVLAAAAAFALLGFAMSCAHEWDGTPAWLATALDLYFKVFANVRNGLFEGFFYVALGMCLGIQWERAVAFPPAASAAMAFLGMAGCVLVTPDAHLPFCAMFALGAFLLSVHRHGEDAGEHVLLRNASTGVYLTHMIFVVVFIYGICGSTDPSSTMNSQVPHLATFAFAVACSLATSTFALRLARGSRAVKVFFGF